jgi:hypothetical protein
MYYYNTLTGQTTWEKPPAMLQAERDAAAKAQAEAQAAARVEAAAQAAAAAAAADPWDAHVDPSSGKTFYVNRLTQQTVRVLSHEPLLTVYAAENQRVHSRSRGRSRLPWHHHRPLPRHIPTTASSTSPF